MARFSMHDFKQQASSFIRGARLALTDVSRVQLLTEEATNADPWGPETKTMRMLSTTAFEREEYERIVQVLHDRLAPNAKRPWRQLYKTLIVLEYLLTHGPSSLSSEFRSDSFYIEELTQYNFVDQQGIDRGAGIRQKADRVLELLVNVDVRKEERNRARKITHGIHGFGSSKHGVTQSQESGEAQPHVLQSENVVSQSVVLTDESWERTESQSLLGGEISGQQKVQTYLVSESDWQPFEKCVSLPTHIGRDNETLALRAVDKDKLIKTGAKNGNLASSSNLFKKINSSPAHFRDTTNCQPFDDENTSNRSDMIGLSDKLDYEISETEMSGGVANSLSLKERRISDGVSGEYPSVSISREVSTNNLGMRHRFSRHKLRFNMFSEETPPRDASECIPMVAKSGSYETVEGSHLIEGSQFDAESEKTMDLLSHQSDPGHKTPMLHPPPKSNFHIPLWSNKKQSI